MKRIFVISSRLTQVNRFVSQINGRFVLIEFFFAESNQNSKSGIFFLKIFNCELKEN